MTLSLCGHHSKRHWFYLLIPSTVIVIIWLNLESDMERQDNWWKVRNQNSFLIAEWKDLSQSEVKSTGKAVKLVLRRQSWKDQGRRREGSRSRSLRLLSGEWLPVSLSLTSASSTILLPSGHITWSTWDLTLSQVSSGVRRLAWNTYSKRTSLATRVPDTGDRKMLKGAISNSKSKEATNMPDGEYLSWVG